MQTAVRVFRDRPYTLPDPDHPGWVDNIAIHDAEYLRMRAEWKRKALETHPDIGGNDLAFRRMRKAQDKWESSELAWYARRGLLPPARPEPKSTGDLNALLNALRPVRFETRDRIATYQRTHPGASRSQIAEALGLTVQAVRRSLSHRIVDRSDRPLQKLLRLLVDQQPHTFAECKAVSGKYVSSYVHRLRARGFDIITRRVSSGMSYQLFLSYGLSSHPDPKRQI